MKYYDIKQGLVGQRVFSMEDIKIIDPEFREATLYDWEKNGRVIKLRSKRYIFSDFKPENFDLYLIANKIYFPSYISLELALNHYGIIPEAVIRVTSISTNKTLSVATKIGIFDYKSVDKKLFFGYQIVTSGDVSYKIATLEKALIDYCYFNSNITSPVDFASLRFNIDVLKDNLHIKELNRMTHQIGSQALDNRVNLLLEYIRP